MHKNLLIRGRQTIISEQRHKCSETANLYTIAIVYWYVIENIKAEQSIWSISDAILAVLHRQCGQLLIEVVVFELRFLLCRCY